MMPDHSTNRIRDMEPQFEAAWPTSRLRDTATTGQLCMLILYMPVGLVVFLARCVVFVIWLVRGLPGGYARLNRWLRVVRKVSCNTCSTFHSVGLLISRMLELTPDCSIPCSNGLH